MKADMYHEGQYRILSIFNWKKQHVKLIRLNYGGKDESRPRNLTSESIYVAGCIKYRWSWMHQISIIPNLFMLDVPINGCAANQLQTCGRHIHCWLTMKWRLNWTMKHQSGWLHISHQTSKANNPLFTLVDLVVWLKIQPTYLLRENNMFCDIRDIVT